MRDILDKHFLQVFGVFLVLLAVAFDSMFFFVNYPERNHDTITMVAGAVNANMITGVLAFFYGSSKGSKDAADRLNQLKNESGAGA